MSSTSRQFVAANLLLIANFSFLRDKFLESFLRCKGDGSKEYANVHCKLNDRQLLKIALQVALGMKHLEEQKVNRTFS